MIHLLQLLKIVLILQILISMKQVQVDSLRVQSSPLIKLRGRYIVKEAMDEYIVAWSKDQVST